MKFTHDQIMRRYGEQPASCKYFIFKPKTRQSFTEKTFVIVYYNYLHTQEENLTKSWRKSLEGNRQQNFTKAYFWLLKYLGAKY